MKVFLSLFRGIGLADRAAEEVFPDACLVCGPDIIWGGDVKRFHVPAGVFDGVFGGPPCQCWSRLVHMVRKVHGEVSIAENLIPEFERVVSEAQPRWFLMENAPDSPPPVVPGYQVHSQLINNRWFWAEQNRVRRISFGTPDGRRLDLEADAFALEPARWEHTVLSSSRTVAIALDRNHKPKQGVGVCKPRTTADMLRLQGFPGDMLDDCPLTDSGKKKVIANGWPLPMGRAVFRAVRRAMYEESPCPT